MLIAHLEQLTGSRCNLLYGTFYSCTFCIFIRIDNLVICRNQLHKGCCSIFELADRSFQNTRYFFKAALSCKISLDDLTVISHRIMETIGCIGKCIRWLTWHVLASHCCGSLYATRCELLCYRLGCAIHKFVCFIENHCITFRQNGVRINNFDCKQGVVCHDNICFLRMRLGFRRKTLRAPGTDICAYTFATR